LTSRPALLLFAGSLLVYNLNLRPIPSGDTLPTALLPVELVLHHRTTFDAEQPLLEQSYGGNAYFLYARQGHYHSLYPIGQPLLLTPLYEPLALVPGARQWPASTEIMVARILEKLMASAMAALSVALLFLLLRRMVDGRRALLLAAVYGFATNTWSTSSQALWQHGASQLSIVASLLCLARFLGDRDNRAAAIGAGFFAALSFAMRPTDIFFFGASLLVAVWRTRRPVLLAAYAVSGVLIGGPLCLYNLQVFGSVRGGYTAAFNGSFWSGLAGLTFSPSHGLFIFTPVLLFALAGIRRLPKGDGPADTLLPIACLFVASQLMLYSLWPYWWGGDCYGPRMLTDTLSCMVLLLAASLDLVARYQALRVAFALALALSVTSQLVGAFCFPRGFQSPEPLWDWRHSPILENARHGVNVTPYRVVARFASDVVHGRTPDTQHTGLLVR